MPKKYVTIDGNEAAASVAHRLSEVIAIYPITPSSTMGEHADDWSSAGKPNLWGSVPTVVEMQSEAGAVGTIHGALQTGSLATTFTSSQGLLLMIPNMYKIAGELTSVVIHVAARAVAAQALSIFGDHQDVMAARATGWALLSSSNVQECYDLALIAHAATLESRIPFIHFFDGMRTSHEIAKVSPLADDTFRAMIDDKYILDHRRRGLNPENPVLRGSSQNPDVYFQAREAVNPYYMVTPEIVQRAMDTFAGLTGRQYRLFEYHGAPDADRVIVVLGSAGVTASETAVALNKAGEKVGVMKVHLFRPFSAETFVKALPPTVRSIAVLDRTKEPGSGGEPLYLDIVTALMETAASGVSPIERMPRVVGGRYGLASKEFTPAMAKAVFDNLKLAKPKNHFTVGINDDVTHLSLPIDDAYSIERPGTVRCLFYGLGSDGTVSANKSSIKIIGEETNNFAQGYFVYDSKKAGSLTISHLRFGPEPINAPYLVTRASFVACHQFNLLEHIDVLEHAEDGATFLLNSTYAPEDVWDRLPRTIQEEIIRKKLRFFSVDAYTVAREAGIAGRVNTVMQTCFFAISGILPRDEAIAQIKKSIVKAYGKRGQAIIDRNYAAVDRALENLREITPTATATSTIEIRPPVPDAAPTFVREVIGAMIGGHGDKLPVSALPVDGSFPVATTRWEKRNITLEIPVWEEDTCIQCGKCVFVCPHAVIREKIFDPALLAGAPSTFKGVSAKWRDFPNLTYSLQVSPEDCTGCGLCVEACPVKDKVEPTRRAINMADQPPIRHAEAENFEFFLRLPEVDRSKLNPAIVKDSQLLRPLFEFSGACAGCGETPYLKLLTQLYGDRTIVANATGCSSIYGGNMPTTPWAKNDEGRGPAWANSLFEDNAEFGLGFRLSVEKQKQFALELLKKLRGQLNRSLVTELTEADQTTEAGIRVQRERVAILNNRLRDLIDLKDTPEEIKADARRLVGVSESLTRRSIWLVGGDGWAYDIGYGGLDHVLASGNNLNVLVMDTEVYSNTGGQASKATPRGAVARFASGGKHAAKKDLGLISMTYGSIYVARVAFGANDQQCLRAFIEADQYNGPSLIIAYSNCIAHGYDLRHGIEQQRLAVASGYWPLYRYNPDLVKQGKNPFTLDSKPPSIALKEFAYNENRWRSLSQTNPVEAAKLLLEAEGDVQRSWRYIQALAAAQTTPVNGQSGAEKVLVGATKG
ncbi:MAG: pyruvate:ferredoxin (flavodoxin) oxidoreductase [Chloroflexota bacterium]|nr:MAG: pyruvate:ferredoxin (flavodoxin) oxidoreductase [Chloroflexota bacterium]